MGESKKRKNEINEIKMGTAYRINLSLDDYDNAADILRKYAKVSFTPFTNIEGGMYKVESFGGTRIEDGDDELKNAIRNFKVYGDAEMAMRVKNAVMALFKSFNEMFPISGVKTVEQFNEYWERFTRHLNYGQKCVEVYFEAA